MTNSLETLIKGKGNDLCLHNNHTLVFSVFLVTSHFVFS